MEPMHRVLDLHPAAPMGSSPRPTGDGTGPRAPVPSRPEGGRNRAGGWRRWSTFGTVAAAGALVLAACSSGTDSGAASKSKSKATTTTTTHVTATGPRCPLTGAPAPGGGSPPQRPPLAFKVDNYPTARPQTGLNKADVIFEEPVEGGITRLVAVFQCQQGGLVGPLRSARYPDLGIADLLSRPIFAHVGGIDPILALIRSGNLVDRDLRGWNITQHPPGRVGPYDTYATTAATWGTLPDDHTPPAPVFTYGPAAGGSPVSQVHIPFSWASDETWTWSASTSSWHLAYSGVAATNADGTPVTATNVVVQTVQTTLGPWAENSLGAREVEVNATSGGKVLVLRNGQAISGTWSRASLSAPLRLATAAGAPLHLAPGATWVAMVPSQIPVTSTPAG